MAELEFDVPGQQFADAVERMIGDDREDVAQVRLGIDAVEFGGLCRPRNYAERYWSDALIPWIYRTKSRTSLQFHSA